jgi:predicted metal-dependent phosphotriesterase family hydrolase
VSWVETVLGPRPAETLDVVDAHAHLWIAPAPRGSPELSDEELALRELRDLRAVGGRGLIDCQPGGCGRDGEVLRRLMDASGVVIVAVTGFHMRRHYPDPGGPWAEPSSALEVFRHELRDGLREARASRAGVVKCAWTGANGVERELLGAAVEAARSEGAPLLAHTERGRAVEGLADLILGAGLPPGRAQLSHVDKRPDVELHLELARAGFVLGYDTFLRPKYGPEKGVWPLLRTLVDNGLWSQVTLGTDLVQPDAWHVCGGPGLRSLVLEVVGRLRREGVPGDALAALAGGNALRLLARHAEVGA